MKQLKHRILLLLALAVAMGAHAFSTDTIKVATKHLATPEDVTVIVPDGASGHNFPVVYLLNGYDGNHIQWTRTRPGLGDLADRYGMIFVLPDGRDSWYWDSPVRPDMQMESFFIKDLVPYIDANYPTLRSRDKRAITGFSMGGHGALWLATRHPDIFGSMGSMSGGVNIIPFPKNWKMASLLGPQDTNMEVWKAHTVASLVPQMKDANLNITIDCGTDDFFAGVNDDLHKALLDAKVPHDYTVRPGAHTHAYWGNSILYHLLFFNEAFKK